MSGHRPTIEKVTGAFLSLSFYRSCAFCRPGLGARGSKQARKNRVSASGAPTGSQSEADHRRSRV
jgi:hypothetical protein